jgi:hypothetical protein
MIFFLKNNHAMYHNNVEKLTVLMESTLPDSLGLAMKEFLSFWEYQYSKEITNVFDVVFKSALSPVRLDKDVVAESVPERILSKAGLNKPITNDAPHDVALYIRHVHQSAVIQLEALRVEYQKCDDEEDKLNIITKANDISTSVLSPYHAVIKNGVDTGRITAKQLL